MGRNISLPKKFVEEIAKRAGIANKESGQLSDNDINKFIYTLKILVTDVTAWKKS